MKFCRALRLGEFPITVKDVHAPRHFRCHFSRVRPMIRTLCSAIAFATTIALSPTADAGGGGRGHGGGGAVHHGGVSSGKSFGHAGHCAPGSKFSHHGHKTFFTSHGCGGFGGGGWGGGFGCGGFPGGGGGFGWGGGVGWGGSFPYGYPVGLTTYVPSPPPYPPYYSIYPPVYYSPFITKRHYGASPYAWLPGMSPITYLPPRAQFVMNPHASEPTPANTNSVAKSATTPQVIHNPFVSVSSSNPQLALIDNPHFSSESR
jgi:hypothetical protein